MESACNRSIGRLYRNIVNVDVTAPENERQQSVNTASTQRQQSVNRVSTILGLHLVKSRGCAMAFIHDQSIGHLFGKYG